MLEGLTFERRNTTTWAIMFHGMQVGRILSNHSQIGTTVRTEDNFPQFPYSTRCEITKAAWEQAKLIDITARLLK